VRRSGNADRGGTAVLDFAPKIKEPAMSNTNFLDEFSKRLGDLFAATPAKDLEKNAKTMFVNMLSRMDLVTREEFDVQREVLARARERLAALENRIADLEARLAERNGRSS
jgi:ubiquinone biosynthesis accessory factor UbiK